MVSRRSLLAGSAALALSACVPAPTPSETPSTTPEPSPSPTLGPFGLVTPSTVNATVHAGTFGSTIITGAAALAESNHPGLKVSVRTVADINADVEPTLATDPPDLVNNSGDGKLALGGISEHLLPLDELLEASNLDGAPIRNMLMTGALTPGIVNGQQLAIQYTLMVHGLWYSDALFSAHAWTPPETWDELFALGEAAAGEERALFYWDPVSANDFLGMVIASAIKEDGHDLRRALDNLEPDAWHNPAIELALGELRRLQEAEFIVEVAGGARQRWSVDGGPALCPSGATLLRDTIGSMRPDFLPAVAPVPTLTRAPMLPVTAVQSVAEESFFVPRAAANIPGALELLRTMLSREVAAEFSARNQLPTVVRGATVSSDSPGLISQTRLLASAGDDVFNWRFLHYYGLSLDAGSAMTDFLRGTLTSSALLDRLQTMCDEVRDDPDIVQYVVD